MADIVLKPVDGALYKTIKPYMIENLAAFLTQSRSACEKEIDALLPDGENTKKHYLYAIEIKSTCAAGNMVGYLWFFVVKKEGKEIAFLMDIFVLSEYRRKSIAREKRGYIGKKNGFIK